MIFQSFLLKTCPYTRSLYDKSFYHQHLPNFQFSDFFSHTMSLFLHPKPFFFLIVTCTLILAPKFCSARDDQRFQNCSTSLIRCGSFVDISYPFWGSGRADYCGYPGFMLTCTSNTLQITISSASYRVLAINTTSETLSVARSAYFADLCPTNLTNTTLDNAIFNYTSDTGRVLVSYGCNTSSNASSSGSNRLQLSCRANTTDMSGFVTTLPSEVRPGFCSESVVLPMYQSGIQSVGSNWSTENFIRAINAGFGLRWFAQSGSCQRCARSGGQCGWNPNQNSNLFICYCRDGPSDFVCRKKKSLNPNTWSTPLSIGIAVIVAAICYYRGSKARRENRRIKAFLAQNDALAPRRYSYSEIKKMTNSFKDKLGQGGYGSVYKGKLPDDRLVAVKVLKVAKGGVEGFINEVGSISKTSHVNVVTLLGYCFSRTKRALIYEFMPNGSLDKYIGHHSVLKNNGQALGWKTLYEIAVGIARGLEYLHLGCNTRIVHFDIKPHNILLDENFCPKISDFGLAKLSERRESVVSMTGARGTIGYIAPEVFVRNLGAVSHKSDVYSYGMMVLEMVGERHALDTEAGDSQTSELYFPAGVYKYLEQRNDLDLQGNTAEEMEENSTTRKMSIVGLWCIQTNPSDRPSMTQVLEMLQGSLQSLEMPPKPFASSSVELPSNSLSVDFESSSMV